MKNNIMKWLLGLLTLSVVVAGGFFGWEYTALQKEKQAEAEVISGLDEQVVVLEKQVAAEKNYDTLKAESTDFSTQVTAIRNDVTDLEYDEAAQRDLARRLDEAEKNYQLNLQKKLREKEAKILSGANKSLSELKKKTAPMLSANHLPLSEKDFSKTINGLKKQVSQLTTFKDEAASFQIEADDLVKNYHTKVDQAKQLEKERQAKAKREKEKKTKAAKKNKSTKKQTKKTNKRSTKKK